ncbi:uncharacterized protein L969DRAFT_46188 [Mixia osmundae IAM 14324]|uniref:FAS1 domain-containing protein n=1 Tax=Mixia osmundae (strain CBS 9802 / IAM 14324 / JCM 22182 / KY 12970) TaxID=764103 RepID=G7DUA1_MIXOS|nr:uncharacterized protein L969DRAFT_46188 [Mixia osmundae IAM 14324]KEI41032.1 hypothetical protein L969DRAFT_46188 [Mixia osmundae IAM 14324]GAA94161.1 hypothetical protein E5Q_00809 [Mixia osmundae IAM 14324]
MRSVLAAAAISVPSVLGLAFEPALRSLGHTKTADFFKAHPQYLTPLLAKPKPLTFVSPSDAAWERLMPSVWGDNEFIGGAYLAYHMITDKIDVAALPENERVTYRTAAQAVPRFPLNIGKGVPAAVSFVKSDNEFHVLYRAYDGNDTVRTTPALVSDEGVTVFSVDSFFDVPNSDVLSVTEGTPHGAVAFDLNEILQYATPNADALRNIKKPAAVTLFMPNNTVFGPILKNKSIPPASIAAAFRNAMIKGAVLHSSQFDKKIVATSSGGQVLTIEPSPHGTIITSGKETCKLVYTDIEMINGIVHIIDCLFSNTAIDEAKAKADSADYLAFTESSKNPKTGKIDGTTPTPFGAAHKRSNRA